MTFIKDLEDEGVVFKMSKCDVFDIDALKALLEHYSTELPPLGGCIQAAMVLNVWLQIF